MTRKIWTLFSIRSRNIWRAPDLGKTPISEDRRMENMNEIISAYSMNPPNIGLLEDPSIAHKEQSRLCGDTIEVSLKIEEGKVSDY